LYRGGPCREVRAARADRAAHTVIAAKKLWIVELRCHESRAESTDSEHVGHEPVVRIGERFSRCIGYGVDFHSRSYLELHVRPVLARHRIGLFGSALFVDRGGRAVHTARQYLTTAG